ncbi:Lhr-like helicase with C-terminal Zn finger domain [Methanonatronarchaeum thermophilum]|uniref:Lhr-like helicase with C-terminal Zn finger domain n=1 Tax=Methanonatronarchaeum thermophilum TaxID=1927129 RepID=A0A1Y3GFM2_9EURY|nr:ATP-dependent helicase [Methanonatronarchaeum thermophilum]OUJ18176.1 Lhr-like helicase with C-terminal Zn finger domain [Methanonatronarchaeum thermophilum]
MSLEPKSELKDVESYIIDEVFEPSVRDWWVGKFGRFFDVNDGYFTPPQRGAIPNIYRGENTLVCAPTGSGKTLSSFASIINELYKFSREDELENTVYCLYISPLKSLANDIHRNLVEPLRGIEEIARERGIDNDEIRHAIRHGDTPKNERAKMLDTTPHILNTTPETLAILLNSPKFKEKLRSVRWVIVDEIHSLAEGKRGVHLSLSLERLQEMAHQEFVRIGCSATVEPVEEVARFLVGSGRDFEVVDTRFIRDMELSLRCPTDDLINTDPEEISEVLYTELHDLIQEHDNTLIFTNTRSGAERVLKNLRSKFPEHYFDENTGCHHGSLGREKRVDIEEKLKGGEIDFVTTSTSLELGVDMPHLDLVVQIGSPKSVSKLLQRIGRSGHSLHHKVKGIVFVMDRDELLECSVMLKHAEEGFIDRVFIPTNCLDVLSQHIYGMAINSVKKLDTVKKVVRRSYCYSDLPESSFDKVIKYLTADYAGMEDKNIYAKIWYDSDSGEIGRRGGMSRVIYMTNLGTIPASFSCGVYTRDDKKRVGSLDEQYLDKLEKGDVFHLGGDRYEFRYRRGGKVYVDRTDRPSNVPRWFSERLPLSYDLAIKILLFKKKMRGWVSGGSAEEAEKYLKTFPIDENAVKSLVKMFMEQVMYSGGESISTPNNFYVEQYHDSDYRKRFLFQSTYGRKFNDGLSRLLAHEVSRRRGVDVSVSISDFGFTLSFSNEIEIDFKEVIDGIDLDMMERTMKDALQGTEMLKRMFRINAVRSFMILENYKGNRKSGRRQQFNSDMMINYALSKDDFAVVDETYREIFYDKLELDHVEQFINKVQKNEVEVTQKTVRSPSPFMFGTATLDSSDVVLAEDRSSVIKQFHKQVIEEIGLDDP